MWLGYTHAQGCPVLRQEIADHMLADEGGVGGAHHCPLSVSPEHVNVVVPAEGIFLATMALLQPGDGVICAMPCYQSLHQLAETANCRVVPWLPRTRRWLRESCSARSEFVNGYHFDVEDLRQLVLQVLPDASAHASLLSALVSCVTHETLACTSHPSPHTLHPALHTPHPTPHTPRLAPCTAYPALCTPQTSSLHPNPGAAQNGGDNLPAQPPRVCILCV